MCSCGSDCGHDCNCSCHGLNRLSFGGLPTVPRVATSLDDLRVGQVVAYAGPLGNGYVRTVTRIGSNRSVRVGQYDTAYRLTDDSFEIGQVYILSDQPPDPVTVSREAMDRLFEVTGYGSGQPFFSQYGHHELMASVRALVDEVKGTTDVG